MTTSCDLFLFPPESWWVAGNPNRYVYEHRRFQFPINPMPRMTLGIGAEHPNAYVVVTGVHISGSHVLVRVEFPQLFQDQKENREKVVSPIMNEVIRSDSWRSWQVGYEPFIPPRQFPSLAD